MITINIKLKKHSPAKKIFHKLYSKSEDFLFTLILKVPEKFIPHFVMEWLDRYTAKRINELKQQNVKLAWKKVELQKTVDNITDRQQR